MARYKYTSESGTDFKVSAADKCDALESENEVRQILDDLGELLGHSKFNDAYPKDGSAGGTIDIRRATTKTETGTLTAAEGGLVKVSAASAYILYLPTAVGNTGLEYTIIKTDNNTNLITIDANGTETINGALTFTGLNYQWACASFKSDGANWVVKAKIFYPAQNKLSAFAATTSAELAGVISDETGTGALVFGTLPKFTDEISFSPKKSQALVTFIFDDSNDTDYTVMKPVFDAQGEVACSAIWTDKIEGVGFLTAAQLLELQSAGWETLSHSKTHPHLTALSEAEIRGELEDSKNALEALGLTVNNFAYPFNQSNEIVRRITREYYRAARSGWADLAEAVNSSILNTYALYSVCADDHTTLATYETYVDSAESGNRWIIFYLHSTDADDVAMMNELIDYIQAKNISIVTMNQALDLIGNMIDIGDNFAVGEKGMRATSPTLVTPVLGVASATSLTVSSFVYREKLEGGGGLAQNEYIDSSFDIETNSVYMVTLMQLTGTNTVGDTGQWLVARRGTGTVVTDILVPLYFTCTMSTYKIRITNGDASTRYCYVSIVRML